MTWLTIAALMLGTLVSLAIVGVLVVDRLKRFSEGEEDFSLYGDTPRLNLQLRGNELRVAAAGLKGGNDAWAAFICSWSTAL